jgi:hypothetical protein
MSDFSKSVNFLYLRHKTVNFKHYFQVFLFLFLQNFVPFYFQRKNYEY